MALNIYNDILHHRQQSKRMLTILLDQEKSDSLSRMDLSQVDYIFVGGSTGEISDDFIGKIRQQTSRPIILFPGNTQQFNPKADALLFLSLLSCRDADFLLGKHISVARYIQQSQIETIPLGYILVDGGRESSVQRATHTSPIPQTQVDLIVDTAITAELLGKQMVYLEAGSGALIPVAPHIISAVKQHLSVPLIVGGGICSPEQLYQAYEAGADMVVIGNYLEQHPEDLPLFINERNRFNQHQ